MSVHDKMQTDYLWVRHAPVEEGVKVRNHGFYFMYDRAPNAAERLEMTYRSIGKQYDWELQKFRVGKKGVDRGNKKRSIKNLFRFIKNPIGYVLWKSQRWLNPAPKLLTIGGILYFFGVLYAWNTASKEVDEVDRVLTCYGKNVEGSSGRMKGYHNKKLFLGLNHIDRSLKIQFSPDMVVLNPTWKQNLRKELQLTNIYNVAF